MLSGKSAEIVVDRDALMIEQADQLSSRKAAQLLHDFVDAFAQQRGLGRNIDGLTNVGHRGVDLVRGYSCWLQSLSQSPPQPKSPLLDFDVRWSIPILATGIVLP